MNNEKELLIKAKELFFKYGLKSITMDDIAKEMGISKKTLYLFVENKADLINKTLLAHFEEDKCRNLEITAGTVNAIDEILLMAKHSLRQLRNMHPSALYDLKKYYPQAWKILDQYKSEYSYKILQTNLEKGKKEGLYRNEINNDVIIRIYINSIDYIVNAHNFPAITYNFTDLYKEFLRYHLHGIVTEKGYKKIQNIEFESNE